MLVSLLGSPCIVQAARDLGQSSRGKWLNSLEQDAVAGFDYL